MVFLVVALCSLVEIAGLLSLFVYRAPWRALETGWWIYCLWGVAAIIKPVLIFCWWSQFSRTSQWLAFPELAAGLGLLWIGIKLLNTV